MCPHRACDQAFSIGTSFLFEAMPKARTVPTRRFRDKRPERKGLSDSRGIETALPVSPGDSQIRRARSVTRWHHERFFNCERLATDGESLVSLGGK
jgi:hypothetical protein